LSLAERALGQRPAGVAEVQEFRRQLFTNSCDSLRQEIRRITGLEVREAVAEVELTTWTVVKLCTIGAVVQMFLLARGVPADSWSSNRPSDSVQRTEVRAC
jgi:hypothetical protein